MSDFTIERARRQDAEVLAEMYAADMRDLGFERNADDLLPLVIETLEVQGVGVHTFVARDEDGEIAGVILADPFWSLKVAGKALWIEELLVRPSHRRRGVGQLLVEYLLDWAYDEGFKGIELESYMMNTGASILYRELDFRRLARERYCYYFDNE